MTTATDTATLIDRAQVIDTLNRMAWDQDRKRWTELEDLLADEIQVGYGEDPEVELVTVSRGDLIANWRSGLDHTSSQHILTGITVDAVGNTAHATLNETAFIQGKTPDGLSLYQFGTNMECALRRAPAGWRITSLKVVLGWSTGDPAVLGSWRRPNDLTRVGFTAPAAAVR